MHHSVMSYEFWIFSMKFNICKYKEVVKLQYAFLRNIEEWSHINGFLYVKFHLIKILFVKFNFKQKVLFNFTMHFLF